MPFDFTTAIKMTRSYSVLLADANNPTDVTVQETLSQHGLPRVKMFLLTASDNQGKSVLFENLTDMADSMKAVVAQNIIESLIDEPIVGQGIRRAAAAFSASWLLLNRAAVVDTIQSQAEVLEKNAIADLDRLCKSPMMSSTVAKVATTQELAVGLGVDPSLFIATDVDPATLDLTTNMARPYDGAQLPYVGAPDAGRASAIINGVAVEVTVEEGDQPVDVVRKLALEFSGLPNNVAPNCSLAPSEVAYTNDTRMVEYTDPLTFDPIVGPFRYPRTMAKLTILPKNYDNVLDVAVMTIYLSKRIEAAPTTFEPGIVGLIYGSTNTTQGLTPLGPHSIACELKTGKTATIVNPAADPDSTIVSDSFFFLDAGTPTTDNSELTYRVNNGTVRTVAIPAGSDAARICEYFAQDLAAAAGTQKVLGAVRPSSKITVNGTVLAAPGIEMVAFGIEQQLAYIVVHVLTVPHGITFGVVPSNLITQATFDNRAKSIVVGTKIAVLASQGGEVTPPGGERAAEVIQVTHVPSTGLQSILDRMKKIR